jgi:hypothetical protein
MRWPWQSKKPDADESAARTPPPKPDLVDHQTAAGEFGALLRFRTEQARTVARKGPLSEQQSREYQERVTEFKSRCPGPGVRVAIFGDIASGALVSVERATFLIQERHIGFDWSSAQQILHRADDISDQAADWWPWIRGPGRKTRKLRRRGERNDHERRSHIDRAFNLMTAILSAIAREQRRVAGRKGEEEEIPSAAYESNMRFLQAQVRRAEVLLSAAAQREAQTRYARGMLIGAGLLGGVCAVTGGLFYLTATPAADGVALLAGGLGAFVSVFQRMTSGSLRLDYHAGSDILLLFGALRPWLGAILGMAVFVFIAGGLPGVVAVNPDHQLAFYAAIGFIAGFNERFAQDMLAGSAQQLSRQLPRGGLSGAGPGPPVA